MKIRFFWFEIESDTSKLNRINRIWEWAKREVYLQLPQIAQYPYIFKVKHASKKIHLLLEWYGWKALMNMMALEYFAADLGVWNGKERRSSDSDDIKFGKRFYEKIEKEKG